VSVARAPGARGVTRIALIDSGVNLAHPHVRESGEIVPGPTIGADGRFDLDAPHTDRIGHGTAAAAAILDLAPGSTVYSIRVFAERPECPFERVLAALRHALEWQPRFVNLSLGTTEARWTEALLEIARDAARDSVEIVSPAAYGGLPSRPGCLEGFTGVLMDARLSREGPERRDSGGRSFWYASPYPRDLPGLPRSANLSGPSMAAANLTGYLARRAAHGEATSRPSSTSA
jgi:subtilisin family serine protease